ncbi:MAG: NAD(P)-dependent methylenetetrahydromethanopterin dehydrogenase [Candidatus Helarchaeota archaeon]
MEVLELEPLKKKTLKLFLVETEFRVNWWLQPPPKNELDFFSNPKINSREYIQFIENLVQKYQPDFVAIERGLRTDDEFLYDNPLIDVFKQHNIPCEMVDISENAANYIESILDDKRSLLKRIKKEVLSLSSSEKGKIDNHYLQRLIQWGSYLEEECNYEENEVRYKIREAWMMKGILNLANKLGSSELKDKKEITAFLICDKDHFDGFTKLADELGINLTKIHLKKSIKNVENVNSLAGLINHSILEIIPVKVKKKGKQVKILYIFDTDDYTSPFDINMAYDAGFDVVVPFSKVTAKTATKLTQDAIFSRSPKTPTAFFVGGSNVKEAELIAKKVLKALVPPFEYPVIIDPRGSHTTASAIVAKTQVLAQDHGIESLSGKKVVILGTGPVGRIAAILASKLQCQTVLVETWDQLSEEFVKELATNLTKEAGKDATVITGKFAVTNEKIFEVVKDADIIWSVAAAGVQILSKEILSKLPPNKIIIDINAVPPTGVENLKPKHDNVEIYPGIYGTGALALGRLKYMIESKILKEAANTKGRKVFDYNLAFKIAQALLQGKKITVAA